MKGSAFSKAHTPSFPDGPWHSIQDHLRGVESLAVEFAESIRLGEEARLAALLHDLGKYGELFQKRLQGKASGVDHWTIGAWVALTQFQSVEIALAVQGHHIGLQSAEKPKLLEMDPTKFKSERHTLSEVSSKNLLSLQADDGINLGDYKFRPPRCTGANGMLRTRMLFSVLVDSDFLDTESHFARRDDGPKQLRNRGSVLDIDRSLEALGKFRSRLSTSATTEVRVLRNEVFAACEKAANLPLGIFTLTAPTGSGKTLAMLRFALMHAKAHGLRRIIVVLPFLSLIDQTAKIYREIFKDFGENYVLEDHSLARLEESDSDLENQSKLLSENWDAPIIITTNVRLFEALHHNRPSVCRKLHRVARSVLLCDEVQTLPLNIPIPGSLNPTKADVDLGVNLIAPTLATLASLAAEFESTILFATATQPAFAQFGAVVKKLASHDWKPKEIIDSVNDLFQRSCRVAVDWRFETTSWVQLADEVKSQPGTLIIVNTRRDAATFAQMLRNQVSGSQVYHLSTDMCVAHRQQVLSLVEHENIETTGFLVSTQCVEAGVDLDFCQVYRAWAPLDSIAQAAGRCNRNGLGNLQDPLTTTCGERDSKLATGRVVVFLPENASYPGGGYEQAVRSAMSTVREKGTGNARLHDPGLFRDYFSTLYKRCGILDHESILERRIKTGDYPDVAKLYRLIPDSGDNIIVRVGDRLGSDHLVANAKLLDELEETRLTGKLMRKLRPYTVSAYRKKNDDLPLTPLKDHQKNIIPGWYLLENPAYYDSFQGLLHHGPQDVLIT